MRFLSDPRLPTSMFMDVRKSGATAVWNTANLRTKILDFRGFDSSIILSVRGGIPRPIGNFPESLSRGTLVGIILVGRFGVNTNVCQPLWRSFVSTLKWGERGQDMKREQAWLKWVFTSHLPVCIHLIFVIIDYCIHAHMRAWMDMRMRMHISYVIYYNIQHYV